MNKYILKIEFRYLARFLLMWDRAGRPIKALTIVAAKDPKLVAIYITLDGNDLNAGFWLAQNTKELNYEIFDNNVERRQK